MKPLIIETDLGGDPDDLFAILFLIAAGANINAVVLTPGSPDQIALAVFIRDITGSLFHIGVAKDPVAAKPTSRFYKALLDKYNYPLHAKCGDKGWEVMVDVWGNEQEMLVIGPLSNFKQFYAHFGRAPTRATMQGGFCPYSLYHPTDPVDKFLNEEQVQTYNLNGDVEGAAMFLHPSFARQMVGKNVCHSVIFKPEQIKNFRPAPNKAAEVFLAAASLMEKEKKFHDPVAAVLHLNPMIGTWIKGKAQRTKQGWTTVKGDDRILVDIDRIWFWSFLYDWGQTHGI